MKTFEDQFPICVMARVLGVSASGYYAWRSRPESPRRKENRRLELQIKATFNEVDGVYGSPRIHKELLENRIPCGVNRVARLMRKAGLKAVQAPKYVVTTDSAHNFPSAENLLNRNFSAEGMNEKWAGDITYIRTDEGWLYLSVILDLHSRKVINWATSDTLSRKLVLDALNGALTRRGCAPKLFHSDRGVQYASDDVQRLLTANSISCSMSRKGDCWDNATVESFFHTLKVERADRRKYRSRAEARRDLFDYIERFYNRKRRHSSIGYVSPVDFEELNKVA